MDVKFDCAHCGRKLVIDAATAGQPVNCPACGLAMTVPPPIPQAQQEHASGEVVFCSKCGQQNGQNNYKCAGCGFVLHAPASSPCAVSDDSTLGGLFPYKNASALWAYYMGVFSLLPCIAIPLGIAALVFGLKGLKYAELHPEAKGKGHAWTGIILGGLCALINLVAIVFAIIAATCER